MRRLVVILLILAPFTAISQINVKGFFHLYIVTGTPVPPPPDTLFESVVVNPVTNIVYTPGSQNFLLEDVDQNIFINLIGTANGNTGAIKIHLISGSEQVSLNGIIAFIKPGIPGYFTIHYIKLFNQLTFN